MSQIPYIPCAVEHVKLHDEIEATVLVAAAKPQLVAGAKSISVMLTEGGTVNNRSGEMAIYISTDGGTTFVLYNALIDNLTNTNSQTLTRVASKTRNSAGSDILFFDPATVGVITHVKAQLTITDGATPTGDFTVVLTASY
jgi:hypothetical protein